MYSWAPVAFGAAGGGAGGAWGDLGPVLGPILFLVLPVAGLVWGSLVARSKGHSVWIGLLLALLLGPVGIGVVYVLPYRAGSGPFAPPPGTGAETPAWYPDPWGRFQFRYWDGIAWTGHVATAGRRFADPSGAVPVEKIRRPPTGAQVRRLRTERAVVAAIAAVAIAATVAGALGLFEQISHLGAYAAPVVLAGFVPLLAAAAVVVWRRRPPVGLTMAIAAAVCLAGAAGLWGWNWHGASEALAAGDSAWADGSWRKAVEQYEAISQDYPLSSQADDAEERANDARLAWAESLPREELDRVDELTAYVAANGTPEQGAAAHELCASCYECEGDRCLDNGDYVAAIAAYETAVAESEGEVRAGMEQKLADAARLLARANDRRARALVRKAERAMAAGNPDKAADHLRGAADLTSRETLATKWERRAQAYGRVEDPTRTLEDVRNAAGLAAAARACVKILRRFPRCPEADLAVKAMKSRLLRKVRKLKADAAYYRRKVNEVNVSGSAFYETRFLTGPAAYDRAAAVLRKNARTQGLARALAYMASATSYGRRSVGGTIYVSASLGSLGQCDSCLRSAESLVR